MVWKLEAIIYRCSRWRVEMVVGAYVRRSTSSCWVSRAWESRTKLYHKSHALLRLFLLPKKTSIFTRNRSYDTIFVQNMSLKLLQLPVPIWYALYEGCWLVYWKQYIPRLSSCRLERNHVKKFPRILKYYHMEGMLCNFSIAFARYKNDNFSCSLLSLLEMLYHADAAASPALEPANCLRYSIQHWLESLPYNQVSYKILTKNVTDTRRKKKDKYQWIVALSLSFSLFNFWFPFSAEFVPFVSQYVDQFYTSQYGLILYKYY